MRHSHCGTTTWNCFLLPVICENSSSKYVKEMLGFKPTRLDQTASNVTLQADMPWIMHRITNIPLTFSNLPTALYIIINNVGHWPILLSHVHHSIMHSRALDPSHSSNQTECPEQNLSTVSWAPLISSEKWPISINSVFLYSEIGVEAVRGHKMVCLIPSLIIPCDPREARASLRQEAFCHTLTILL